ncbi:hypothetical protein [Moraxella bovis]|nr:hypothetical protein [Moraxella bovis]
MNRTPKLATQTLTFGVLLLKAFLLPSMCLQSFSRPHPFANAMNY